MTSPFLLALTAALAATPEEPRAFEIADYYRTAFVGAPAVSSSGSRAVFSVRRYDFEAGETWTELWSMSADGSGLRQLTHGRHMDSGPVFAPDGERIVFTSDRAEGRQLFVMPLDGGEPRQLTDWPAGVADPVWSPDGKYLAVTSEVYPECGADADCNAGIAKDRAGGKLSVHVADELLYRHWTGWRDGRYAHVLLVDAETGAVLRDLTPGAFDSPVFSLGGGPGYAFAPDGKTLCFVSNRDGDQAESTNADLWEVSLEDAEAEPRNLTTANRGWDGAPAYSPDGAHIAFLSQQTPGYESDLRRVALLERASGKVRYLTSRQGFDQMADAVAWAPDGATLYFQAEELGRTPLYRVPAVPANGERIELVHRDATIDGWELTPDGSAILYSRRAVGAPPEIFRVAAAGGEAQRLTRFNADLEAEVDIRPAEEMWVRGEDGTRIHVFLVKPHGFDPVRKYPLILNVHGGPQSQWTDGYRGDWQVYPGKGYVVAFANPTGSTGYGQEFLDGIACDWGGRVYRDLMKVTDALEQLPYVDAGRMGAMGWSYGGYMMMWFQGHTERFLCQASMMGLFDLPSFYGATEELWFPEKDLCGTPWTSEHYRRWSPSEHVENFGTPALVVTGELDYRVPYTQSLMYFTALQKQGVPSRLVVFPGAGHWPAWHEMAFYYNAHLDWFHQWLGGEPAPYDVMDYARNRAPSSSGAPGAPSTDGD